MPAENGYCHVDQCEVCGEEKRGMATYSGGTICYDCWESRNAEYAADFEDPVEEEQREERADDDDLPW